MSPVPLSVSSVQIATISSFGTPNCCSMRASSCAFFTISPLARLMRGGIDAGRGIFLEALAVEHAALAAVEGEHVLVERHAGKGGGDDVARDAGGLRVAPHRRQEAVEIAAALRRAGGNGERHEKQDGEDACDHAPTPPRPLVPAQAGIQQLPGLMLRGQWLRARPSPNLILRRLRSSRLEG